MVGAALTKSLFMRGKQCSKRLWIHVHQPEAHPERSSILKLLALNGHRVNDAARKHWRQLVETSNEHHKDDRKVVDLSCEMNPNVAVEKTKTALSDDQVACIFEAAFQDDGALVRTDVLVQNRILEDKCRDPKRWNLIEVKSSSKARPDHLLDASFQKMVVEKESNNIGSLSNVSIMNINPEFEFDGNSYEGLFNIRNVSEEIVPSNEIRKQLLELLQLVDPKTQCPDITMGPHCNKPSACEFKAYCASAQATQAHQPAICTQDNIVLPDDLDNLRLPTLKALLKAHSLPVSGRKKELIERLEMYKAGNDGKGESEIIPKRHEYDDQVHPVTILPRVQKNKVDKWKRQNIHDLRDIPVSDLSNSMHKRIWKSHVLNENFYCAKLGDALAQLGWPRYFMDFEMVQQVVPQIPGSTSREMLPFQWSVHRWNSLEQPVKLGDGAFFIGFEGRDLRVQFLQRLLDQVGSSGPIFVHSIAAERSVLRALASHPDCWHLARQVDDVIDRLHDTLEIAKKYFYSPKQRGSFGLKKIVESIPTTVDYHENGTQVTDGAAAQIAWLQYNDPQSTQAEKAQLRKEMLDYCARDTLAMVDFLRHLHDHVDEGENLLAEGMANISVKA